MEQDVDLPRVKFDPDAGIDSSESQRDCDSDGSMVKPKKNAADREESPPRVTRDVKSTAVVKYSNVQTVANFSKLEEDTDLKLPPANWLRSGANVTVHNTMGTSKTKFSSFGMANSCPDTVGDVDVISAAENIKDLLKIPFSKGQVSIAVHRIGRSLFLDEFDVYRHLRSAPQSGRKWLRNFILQQILRDNKKFTRKKKTRDVLHSRNLLSKFLYYSIDSVPESDGACNSTYTVEEPDDISPDQSSTNSSSHTIKDDISFSTGDISQSHQSEFARQVLWQFEDIQMLIGTDLPIFGGGQYPAVSLRLRDMSKPINVLTGLDYWLDNLICNVPELAMCYHLDGIVKNYELLRTEEIPQIPDSQFSPTVVKDIAQNVLSFLKSNCTKEGHTYWLFKGNNDDVVKLYDLTSLCSENDVNNTWDNPFAVPVALLLYNGLVNYFTVTKELFEFVRQRQESAGAVSSVLSTSAVEKEGQGLLESILSLCGDVHVMLAASSSDNLISHKDNFLQSPEYEKFIMQSVQKEVNYNNFEWASSWSMDAAGFLATSIRCYEFSVELLCDDKENADCIINITRRLANSRNELGKLYMKQAVDLAAADQNDDEIPSQEEQELWKKSYSCFDNAIQSFDAVHDSINQALVNCNAGRLMRICAQAYNIGRFSQQERHYYNK
uniref:Erythroid differentiation-related factor 1-like n=1 Tax=Saccoglossus kowalevskii TaxID=10224 RepID=A0ABM0H084_SACKO